MNNPIIAAGTICLICFQGVLRRYVKRVAMDYKGRVFEQDQPGDWCDTCEEGILNGDDLQATEPAWLAFRDAVDKEEGQASGHRYTQSVGDPSFRSGTPESSVQKVDRATATPLPDIPTSGVRQRDEPDLLDWQVVLIKHLRNRLDTVHGLVFGIPAEMTAFPAFPDLCITARTM